MLEKKLELTENEIYKALPGKNLIIYLLGEIIKFVAYVRNLKFDEDFVKQLKIKYDSIV